MADNTLLLRPNQPFVQTVKYRTDVMQSHSGLEQRVALGEKPRQTYEARVLLPDEASIRKWRAAFYRDVTDNLRLPLWQETVRLTADHAAATTSFTGDFTYTDLAIGDDLIAIDGDTVEELTVVTISASTLTTASTTNAFPAGSAIVPLENAQVPDGSGYQRYPTLAAQMPLTVDLKTQRDLDRGLGSPTLTTYKTLNVLDRRHLNQGLVDERMMWNVTKIDFGNSFEIDVGRPYADIVTARRYLASDASERKWWKTFLHAVNGRREPFWVGTWRPDLVLFEQPSVGGSTIRVTDEPHWIDEYEGRDDELQLETDAGTIYRGVASSVDNFDGTITLTLDSALPATSAGSTINVISFLEQSRLDADEVRFEHFSNYTKVAIGVRSIRQ